jgi:hypothetical protein
VEEFLLLGQIPGTNVVITFWQWAIIFGCLFGMAVVWRQLRHNKLSLSKKFTFIRSLLVKRVDSTALDQVAL